MTTQVWCELKYGMGSDSITLARLHDPQLLAAFKKRALDRARRDANESAAIDPVVHLQDEAEMKRLEGLFDLILPTGEGRQ